MYGCTTLRTTQLRTPLARPFSPPCSCAPVCVRLVCPLALGLGGGGAPDAGSGPSLREFPHGGADACTPRQGVTLLYGPSICTRSVQMDLRRNQVRRPFPTPGSGTLWVTGESLRVRHVSCLPRWTVCPTRSPSQDTNRSTCRGECSWSGPLATPPGRCHLGPLAIGPGRIPPYCSRSDGADTDTGGAPKPQRSGTSPASFAGPCHPAPPRWSLLPCFLPQGPWPLAVPPGSRPVPSAPAGCLCSGMLVPLVARFVSLFFFFFFSALALSAGWRRCWRRGGGGVLAVLPFAQGGGGGCRVAPVVTLPFLRLYPRRSPRGGLHGACPPWARSSRPSVTPPRRGVPGGGSAARYRHPSCPLAISPLPSPLSSVGAGGGGEGGGVRPRCPPSGVSTSQARHWHAARPLSSCWGVRHAAWPLPSPCPRCVLSPGAPPAGVGGPLPALPFPQPPTLGGRRLVGGGGGLSFSCRCPRVVGTRRGFRPSAGGGGLASRLPPSPLLSYARTPGGPPAGARTERALYGHGRVARPALSFLCLPTLPRRPRGGGGGGLFSPPPFPHSPSGGWWWWGGVGRPLRPPSVARTSQACRRHSTTTGRGTWLPRGGGGRFPFGPSRPAPW